MKCTIEHKDGIIEIYITGRNSDKNRVINGVVVERMCGDCHGFMSPSSFDSRIRNGRRQILTKCRQCHRIRKLVSRSISEFGRDSRTEEILGASYDELIIWLNKGTLKVTDDDVHIDHIVPQSLGQTIEDQGLLNHYSNLQLLRAAQNLAKGNRHISRGALKRALAESPDPQRLRELVQIAGIEPK